MMGASGVFSLIILLLEQTMTYPNTNHFSDERV